MPGIPRRFTQTMPIAILGVLVTSGRKITISHKTLFVSALCKRIEKRSFDEARNRKVSNGRSYSAKGLLLASHESMLHLRKAH